MERDIEPKVWPTSKSPILRSSTLIEVFGGGSVIEHIEPYGAKKRQLLHPYAIDMVARFGLLPLDPRVVRYLYILIYLSSWIFEHTWNDDPT